MIEKREGIASEDCSCASIHKLMVDHCDRFSVANLFMHKLWGMAWSKEKQRCLVDSQMEPLVKPDNVNVHRAAAKVIASKSRAARGSVCNVLLSRVGEVI